MVRYGSSRCLTAGCRKVAPGPVEQRRREHLPPELLQNPPAVWGRLECRRTCPHEIDKVLIEGHTYLQAPGHRHAVQPFGRVLNHEQVRVEAEHGVQNSLGVRSLQRPWTTWKPP